MNPLIVGLYALVAVAVAAPVDNTTPIPTTLPTTLPQSQQSFDIIPILKQALDGPSFDGSYRYNYETGNGIQVQEEGHLNNVGTDTEVMEVQGSFSYTDSDGQTYQLSYIADANGFQPQGAHLPTAPPVPPEIQKALRYIAEHPEENEELDNKLENKKLNNEQLNNEQLNNEQLNNKQLNNEQLNNEQLNNKELNNEQLNNEQLNNKELNNEELNKNVSVKEE